MRTVTIQMSVPEGMAPYLDDRGNDASFERNAMLLYPLIRNAVISHGRAAEILGVRKWDLIEYYSTIGIPYLHQNKDDLLADLAAFDRLKETKG